MNALSLLGAIVIGLSLGLTGAGGSILTLPVLVHLAGMAPPDAVALSLLIVGVAALAGAWQRARAGEIHLKAAAMFAISGAVGALLGSRLTHLVSSSTLMITFAVLMVVVAIRMLIARRSELQPAPVCQPARCLLAGLGVGVLTGFLGVGGGFLLMPALMKFARLPLRAATGTSLAIIACNSAAGWFGHLAEAATPWPLAGVFGSIAVVGTLLGGRLAGRLPEKTLRQAFGVLVLMTAAFVIWKT